IAVRRGTAPTASSFAGARDPRPGVAIPDRRPGGSYRRHLGHHELDMMATTGRLTHARDENGRTVPPEPDRLEEADRAHVLEQRAQVAPSHGGATQAREPRSHERAADAALASLGKNVDVEMRGPTGIPQVALVTSALAQRIANAAPEEPCRPRPEEELVADRRARDGRRRGRGVAALYAAGEVSD